MTQTKPDRTAEVLRMCARKAMDYVRDDPEYLLRDWGYFGAMPHDNVIATILDIRDEVVIDVIVLPEVLPVYRWPIRARASALSSYFDDTHEPFSPEMRIVDLPLRNYFARQSIAPELAPGLKINPTTWTVDLLHVFYQQRL